MILGTDGTWVDTYRPSTPDFSRKVSASWTSRSTYLNLTMSIVYTKTAPKGTFAAAPNARQTSPRSPAPGVIAVQKAAGVAGSSSTPIVQPHSPLSNVQQPSIQVTQSPYVPQTNSSPMATGNGYHTVGGSVPPPNTTWPAQHQNSDNTNRVSSSSSTVMQETLGVIDEHITDMRKPGRSVSPRARRATTDSVSEYSMVVPSETHSQLSYIQGEETEEEETGRLNAKEVKRWSPARAAEYLESVGVEKSHCDVFREQEFSGEVLLGMDQSSMFLKELDLGPIGRRLRTWQKIRQIQDEIMPPKPSQTRKISENSRPSSRRASNSTTSVIQRASHAVDTVPEHNLQNNQHQPYSPSHPGRQEGSMGSTLSRISASVQHSPRPSAASIRSLGHSRRQSSMDQTITSSTASTPQTSISTTHSRHNKQSSFDRNWNMSNMSGEPNGSARPVSSAHGHSLSSDQTNFEKRASRLSLSTPTLGHDPEHGYASEADASRSSRRVLRKRDADHSRASSYETGSRLSIFRKSRASSMTRTPVISGPPSAVHITPGSDANKDQRRLSNAPSEATTAASSLPPVTNNKEGELSPVKKDTASKILTAPSPRKGFRAISDAVTGREKAARQPQTDSVSPNTDVSIPQSPSSGTPSGASRSIDLDDANTSKFSTPIGRPSTKRKKTKKETSAYTRGLEKKSPQEQMIGADYSGWMKKKSSNLVTNWKPRLFVLKGKRLSYYYSESDVEERGLIDISGHRVLPADKERLTSLHASITKATSSPTSPQVVNSATFASNVTASPIKDDNTDSSITTPVSATSVSNTPKEIASDGQGFIFKLVPPRAGMSRAVNFTKPTVHYFAVPSIEVGRLWMAALMKATIDRDENVQVVTTYQQKTVSLEKARARKERPPALKSVADGEDGQTVGGANEGGESVLEKVDEAADDAQAEEAAKEEPKQQQEGLMDQMREVTDLSPVTDRASMSPKHEKKSSRSSRIGKRSSSSDGLGIQGLNGGQQQHKAGLW